VQGRAKAASSDARRVLYRIYATPLRIRPNPSTQTVIDLPHRMFYIPVLEVVACSPPVIRMRQRTISLRMLLHIRSRASSILFHRWKSRIAARSQSRIRNLAARAGAAHRSASHMGPCRRYPFSGRSR
jgi:hypothetical protein